MGSIQQKVRDLDFAIWEANRLNKLNMENISLQIKNVEITKSITHLEKGGTVNVCVHQELLMQSLLNLI